VPSSRDRKEAISFHSHSEERSFEGQAVVRSTASGIRSEETMHVTQIIETKQVSDECLSVKIRCCENPKTDSVLSIYGIGTISEQDLLAKIDHHHDVVAAKCHGMAAGKLLITGLITKSKTHGAF
jgi:hypothetical protein